MTTYDSPAARADADHDQARLGSVVTFYSYKGGTGRTMALANIACALADAGRRVLTVDFDFEAPGLDLYLSPSGASDSTDRLGLVDLLTCVDGPDDARASWREYSSPTQVRNLSIITSGRRVNGLTPALSGVDWHKLFTAREGGEIIETLRQEWSRAYEFVFVDSRTGLTDTGGICTIHLPDVIVAMCNPNRQSLEGLVHVIETAQRKRRQLARERGPALILPVVARVDDRAERKRVLTWMDTADRYLSPFLLPWLPETIAPRELLDRVKIPHVPFYSFGEELAVREESSHDPTALSAPYRLIARLVDGRFDTVGDILGHRDDATPLRAPQKAFSTATSDDPDKIARALVVLSRLADYPPPSDSGGDTSIILNVAVPTELVADDEVIDRLDRSQLVLRRAGLVSPTSLAEVDRIPGLAAHIAQNLDVLRWSTAVRSELKGSLRDRLTGELLATGIEHYSKRPEAMTSFERRLVEASLRPADPGRLRIAPGILAWTVFGAIIGAFLGMSLLPDAGAAIGAAGSAVVFAYLATMVSIVVRSRFRVDSRNFRVAHGLTGQMQIAAALRPLGYEATGHGELVVFDLQGAAQQRRLLSARLLLFPVDRLDLRVLAHRRPEPKTSKRSFEEGSDEEVVTYDVSAPRFALLGLHRLERSVLTGQSHG